MQPKIEEKNEKPRISFRLVFHPVDVIDTTMLAFPYWYKEFHINVDAFLFIIGCTHTGGAKQIGHPIYFFSKKHPR
jgi:hypothetical protein